VLIAFVSNVPQKWSKGKTKEKANNLVLFDQVYHWRLSALLLITHQAANSEQHSRTPLLHTNTTYILYGAKQSAALLVSLQ
jgi:hypothetical protein